MHRPRSFVAAHLLLLACLLLTACASGGPINPSFPLTVDAAERDLERMEQEPVRLPRPVVVIGGWGDPLGIPPSRLAQRLRELTGDGRIIDVGMGWLVTFPAARQRVIEEVQEAFPSDDPVRTTEVDVIGFSMGGLVARDAAAAPGDDDKSGRRLRIARLFTIATPHRGADLAALPTLDPLAIGMRRGSEFLRELNAAAATASYPLIPYVRLDDSIVGSANAAPAGRVPFWVPNLFLQMAHGHAYKDPRILADIARRLRGEPPFTLNPPAPLPGETADPKPAGQSATAP